MLKIKFFPSQRTRFLKIYSPRYKRISVCQQFLYSIHVLQLHLSPFDGTSKVQNGILRTPSPPASAPSFPSISKARTTKSEDRDRSKGLRGRNRYKRVNGATHRLQKTPVGCLPCFLVNLPALKSSQGLLLYRFIIRTKLFLGQNPQRFPYTPLRATYPTFCPGKTSFQEAPSSPHRYPIQNILKKNPTTEESQRT